MEQLPREMQCQFILKPSRLATAQQLSGESPPSFIEPSFSKSLHSSTQINTKAKTQFTRMNLQMRVFKRKDRILEAESITQQ